MAGKKNTTLRILVPLLGVVAALGVAYAVYINTGKRGAPANQPSSVTPPAPAPTAGNTAPSAAPASNVQTPPVTSTPPAVTAPTVAMELSALKVQDLKDDPASTNFATMGSLDPKNNAFLLKFNQLGAGIESMELAAHYKTVERKDHVVIQHTHYVPRLNASAQLTTDNDAVVPFATLAVDINGAVVVLATGTSDRFWRQLEPGKFEAFIVNGANQRIGRIEKQYTLRGASNSVSLTHAFTNLTQLPMLVKFITMGPTELDPEFTYGLDARRVRYGYLLNKERDPAQSTVMADEYRIERSTALGKRVKGPGSAIAAYTLEPSDEDAREASWPNLTSMKEGHQLSWIAVTSRFFGVAVHPMFDVAANGPRTLPQIERVDRLTLDRGDIFESASVDPLKPVISLRLTGAPMPIAAGQSGTLTMGVFAGPAARSDLHADPVTRELGLERLVFFKQIGICAPCSFEFLGDLIHRLIGLLHDYVFKDWSLAIIFMVVVVRTVLHPVTKWSQVRMLRFGKQMQGMQPKIKKLQERYGDDKASLQKETAKLWSEEGISPFGMVGCIPMILVMPVWMGVWAVIFHAFELRQEAAFYGIFQTMTGGKWLFLSDLAEPDHVLTFAKPFHVWGLSSLMGPISGLNVLPLVLGAVFFMHQKYLTPPSAGPLTPEQEMQTKMIKVMSVVMFPVMMYNSPSGLSLYFIANSALAIFENQWIRSRAEKQGLLDPENFKKKKGAPTGLMGRIMAAAEEKKNLMEQARNIKDKHK